MRHRIKNTAVKPQVSWDKKLDGPKGPNKESELPPPKAEPKSEPLPCCIKTDATISTPRITKIIFISMTALS